MFQRAVATAAPAPAPPQQKPIFSSMSQKTISSSQSPPSAKPVPFMDSRAALANAKSTITNSSSVTAFVRKRSAESEIGGLQKIVCASELKMHGVFFDENDFDDDDLLDFDEEDLVPIAPIMPPSVTNAPVRSNNNGMPPRATPQQSSQLPWSSSPDERPLTTTRRKLPWGGNKVKQESQEVQPAFAPQKKIPRKLGQNKPNALWEQSPDTVKAKQKEQRAAQAAQIRSKKEKTEGEAAEDNLKKKPDIAPIFLSEEQRSVLKLVLESGKSVFFTGSAGTGKSVLMREIIKELKRYYRREPERVAVTASTGLAACNIGGITLHSFCGGGLSKEDKNDLVKKVRKNAKARKRWQTTKVLVMDEISMVDGDFFDKLEHVARKIRGNERPFGGIQLVITGDFFQLPPVPDSGKVARFAFEAEKWQTTVDATIKLTQVFRQRDHEFAAMLDEMRMGKLSPQSITRFRALDRPIRYEDGLEPTHLFPTREEVYRANRLKMSQLRGEARTFRAIDGGAMEDPQQREKLLSNCMCEKVLELKENAQVLLIKNVDEQLVNGSQGRIKAFMTERAYEIFAGEGALEDGVDSAAMKRSKKLIQAMSANGASADAGEKYPLVEFIVPGGGFRTYLVKPETWKIEQPNGEITASRTQVPLILAWALSIHKSQGQTLERVRVDLRRVFEKGQVYVALSRATCQEGLEVVGFDPKKVMAHPKVCAFYSKLDAAQAVLARYQDKMEEDKKKNWLKSQPTRRAVVIDDD